MSDVLVPLNNKKQPELVAVIDECDADRVLAFCWNAKVSQKGRTIYAIRTNRNGPFSPYLHRLILDAPVGVLIDHKNRDGLDCRRENLRVATRSQNAANASKAAGRSSRFRGVAFELGRRNNWGAHIQILGRSKRLGNFQTEEEAAHAYDSEAVRLFGSFANVNFPLVFDDLT